MRQAGALVAVSILLLLPAAAAAEGRGLFLVDGWARFPVGASASMQPFHAFLADSSGIEHAVVVAPTATLHYFERDYQEVVTPLGSFQTSPPGGARSRIEPLTNVTFELRSEGAEGYLGIYGGPDLSARLRGSTPAEAVAQPVSETSSHEVATEEDPFGSLYVFRAVVKEPHVLYRSPGVLEGEGRMLVKVFGTTISVSSRNGTESLRTGAFPSTVPGALTLKWAVLELPRDALLEVAATTPWTLAAPETALDAEGSIVATLAGGRFRTADAEYAAAGSVGILQGSFHAVLRPMAKDGAVIGALELWGRIESTTLEAKGIQASPLPSSGLRMMPLGLLGALVLLGGAWAVKTARGRAAARAAAPHRFAIEDCIELAQAAGDVGDWAEAREWLERAHRSAPTSVRVCCNLAFTHQQLGDPESALEWYTKAAELGDVDGEVHFHGALTALAAGRVAEEVEGWLGRALEIRPVLAVTVQEDGDFESLAGRPRFEAMLRAAWERMLDEGDGSE